uniref:8.9 kDa family member n=1 Tax=Rhipicephalus appendiculatus TaxID=34631 RepID=A0A131YSF5_RHIAP
MLLKGLAITWWLWLSSCRGNTYANVKLVIVPNVTVTNQTCHYNNHTFNDTMDVNGTCQQRWCYAKNRTVALLECSDPPPGCTRPQKPEDPSFPQCCNTICYYNSPCLTERGERVTNGDTFNSTDPCVRYICRNGTLEITEECPTYPVDQLCSMSLQQGPFPGCCGERVCANGKR